MVHSVKQSCFVTHGCNLYFLILSEILRMLVRIIGDSDALHLSEQFQRNQVELLFTGDRIDTPSVPQEYALLVGHRC